MRNGIILALGLTLGLACARPLAAQVEGPPPRVQAAPDSTVPQGVSPGGAFLRAVLLPGWGHAAIGSYRRGAFYFAAETTTIWMFVRTAVRLGAARDVVALRVDEVESRLADEGVTDPLEVALAVDADPEVVAARGLEEARSQQREDWLAFGIFMILLSGADALVSAHLKDFPDPIDVEVGGNGERMEVGLSVRVH